MKKVEQLAGIKDKITTSNTYISTWTKKFEMEKSKKELIGLDKAISETQKAMKQPSFWKESSGAKALAEKMEKRDALKAKITSLQGEIRDE